MYKCTSLVQSVERRFPKPDVVGSSPTGREKINYKFYFSKKRKNKTNAEIFLVIKLNIYKFLKY